MKFDPSKAKQQAEKQIQDGRKATNYFTAKREQLEAVYNDEVQKLFQIPDEMQKLVELAARFPEQSPKNLVLLTAQAPTAQIVHEADWFRKYHNIEPEPSKFITLYKEGKEYTDRSGRKRHYFDPTPFYTEQSCPGLEIKETTPQEPTRKDYLKIVEQATVMGHRSTPPFYVSNKYLGDWDLFYGNYRPDKSNAVNVKPDGTPKEWAEGVIAALCHREMFMNGRCTSVIDENSYPEIFFASCIVCRQQNIPVDLSDIPSVSALGDDPKSAMQRLSKVLYTAKGVNEIIENGAEEVLRLKKDKDGKAQDSKNPGHAPGEEVEKNEYPAHDHPDRC